jgi:uncharacterized repeat protein (TIGR03943 family)
VLCHDRLVAAVKRTVQATLLVLLGAGILRVSLFTDICLRYVKEGLQPCLIASGVVLVLLGLLGARRDGTAPTPGLFEDDEPQHSTGHDHSGHGSRVGWMLFVPTLVLLFFAPPALGSYTASRDNPKIVEDYDRFEPLPTRGTVPLSMTEFIARVQQDDSHALKGRTVLLSGFVSPGKNGDWDLNRLLVSCCAADSQSLTISMRGVPAPPTDTWVNVTGTWHPHGTLGTPSAALTLDVATTHTVPQPLSPYLDQTPTLRQGLGQLTAWRPALLPSALGGRSGNSALPLIL